MSDGSRSGADAPGASPTLVVGEALVDVVHPYGAGAAVEHVGGSPANVALGLAALGHPTELATLVGEDARGERVLAHLTGGGVRLARGSTAAAATPVAHAALDADGAATYTFDLAWGAPPLPEHHGHVHTGSVAVTLEPGGTAIEEWLLGQRRRGTISYDPNVRPALMGQPHQVRARVEQIIGLADVVKASDEDIAWLYEGATPEQVLPLWGRLGANLVVATRGAAGALAHLPLTGRTFSLDAPAVAVAVADTVGAGDSFMAGLLSALLDAGLLGEEACRHSWPGAGEAALIEAVHRGLATAARTVARAGAHAPGRADLGLSPF